MAHGAKCKVGSGKWIAGPGLCRVPQPKYPAKWCAVQGATRQLGDGSRQKQMKADGSTAMAWRTRARATGGWSKLSSGYDDALSSFARVSRSWQAACRRSQAAHLEGRQAANPRPAFCPLCLQLQRTPKIQGESEYFRALIRLASFLGNRRSLTYKPSHTQPQHAHCPSIPILHRESPVRLLQLLLARRLSNTSSGYQPHLPYT
jgi:hypothetical protein